MSDAFDPYYKWLGIPPAEQPPNHYRLLGIALFESDGDVIDAAAEQRMTFLQNIAQGPQVEHSQRLLNQVAAARLCLLNAEKKAAYDAELRAAQSPSAAESDEPSADDFAFLNQDDSPVSPKASTPSPAPTSPDLPDFSGITEAPITEVPDFSAFEPDSPNEPPAAPTPTPSAELPNFSGLTDTDPGEIPDLSGVDSSPVAGDFAIQTDAPAVAQKSKKAPPKVPAAHQAEDDAAEPAGNALLERIQQLPTWALMAGGSLIAAVLAFVIISLVRGPNITKELRKANQAMLIIDWPTDEREGATLKINDKRQEIGNQRELKYRLDAGKEHHIRIERDGYRPISERRTFEKGKRTKLKLKWKRVRNE